MRLESAHGTRRHCVASQSGGRGRRANRRGFTCSKTKTTATHSAVGATISEVPTWISKGMRCELEQERRTSVKDRLSPCGSIGVVDCNGRQRDLPEAIGGRDVEGLRLVCQITLRLGLPLPEQVVVRDET